MESGDRLPFFEECPIGNNPAWGHGEVGRWPGWRSAQLLAPLEISKHTSSQLSYHPHHIFWLHTRKKSFLEGRFSEHQQAKSEDRGGAKSKAAHRKRGVRAADYVPRKDLAAGLWAATNSRLAGGGGRGGGDTPSRWRRGGTRRLPCLPGGGQSLGGAREASDLPGDHENSLLQAIGRRNEIVPPTSSS